MKFMFDMFPVLLFYIAYKFSGDNFFIATAVIIPASFLQVGLYWRKHRRVETMHVVVLGLVVIFGGLTLILHDAEFLKWKVSIVNWLFGAAFLISQFIGDKCLVERMLATSISVPKPVWLRLNTGWGVFSLAMGFLNLYVFKHFDDATWVNFKVYGLIGLTIVFVVLQAFYLARHIDPEEPEQEAREE